MGIQTVDEYGKLPLKSFHIDSLLLKFPWEDFPEPREGPLSQSRNSGWLSVQLASAFRFLANHILDDDVSPPGGSVHVGPSYIPLGKQKYVQRLLERAAYLAE